MNEPQLLEAEIVQEDSKLVKYAAETGLEPATTTTLVDAFRPIFAKAKVAIANADGVAESVKDATCVTEIRKSHACRLAIRAVRLEAETMHKKQKENALRFGRAVDGFKNILLADITPVEQALQDAEDTAERAEAARKAALKASREAALMPHIETPILGDLSVLSGAEFDKMLADAKLLKQAKLDAIAKAEADRIAKEEADRKERARINAENERLQAEARALEAKAKAERERAEKVLAEERAAAQRAAKAAEEKAAKERAVESAKAKAERDAIEAKAKEAARVAAVESARLRAELEAKAQSERAAKQKSEAEAKAAALAAKKAAAAPDKAKLLAFADLVADLEVPLLSQEELHDAVKSKVRQLASWCAEQANDL